MITANILNEEFMIERNQGAYKRDIVYPEGSIIDGIPIISDTFLEKQEEAKEREAMNEPLNSENVY